MRFLLMTYMPMFLPSFEKQMLIRLRYDVMALLFSHHI